MSPYIADDHALPRVLVCIAGAGTSGATGLTALALLWLAPTHDTSGVFLAAAAFAVFTAVAELLTIASLASDRKMVAWFAWCVTPGHVAGAAAMGYLIRLAGLDAAIAGAAATVTAIFIIHVARRFSLRVFEKHDRRRRPGACRRCGYPLGDALRCPECGRPANSSSAVRSASPGELSGR